MTSSGERQIAARRAGREVAVEAVAVASTESQFGDRAEVFEDRSRVLPVQLPTAFRNSL